MQITLFNSYETEDEETKYNRTVFDIPEHNWQEGTVSTVTDKKLNTAKETTIFIPVTAIPPLKTYIGPKAYANLPDTEKENYFTFKAQDKVVLGDYQGAINNIKDFNKLDNVVTIMTVEDNRFGSLNMRHFNIIAE